MAKHITMTRERKASLPVILRTAKALLAGEVIGNKQRAELERALDAFKDN